MTTVVGLEAFADNGSYWVRGVFPRVGVCLSCRGPSIIEVRGGWSQMTPMMSLSICTVCADRFAKASYSNSAALSSCSICPLTAAHQPDPRLLLCSPCVRAVAAGARGAWSNPWEAVS
jgi:hypothetical protein